MASQDNEVKDLRVSANVAPVEWNCKRSRAGLLLPDTQALEQLAGDSSAGYSNH